MHLLLCRRVCIIINARGFMSEHTLIRGERREEKTAAGELNEQGVPSTATTPGYRQYDINLNFLEHFPE